MQTVSDEEPYLPMEHRSHSLPNDNIPYISVQQTMQAIRIHGVVPTINSIKQIQSFLLPMLLHSGKMPISISHSMFLILVEVDSKQERQDIDGIIQTVQVDEVQHSRTMHRSHSLPNEIIYCISVLRTMQEIHKHGMEPIVSIKPILYFQRTILLHSGRMPISISHFLLLMH